MENIFSVAAQVGMLFLMMGAGVFIARMGWADRDGARQMSNLVLYIATPCVVMQSFAQVVPSREVLLGMAGAALFAAVCHLVGIAVGHVAFRGQSQEKHAVFCMASAFPNCGFMGIPLVSALMGAQAVLYVSVFIAVFHLFSWTYGAALFQPGKKPGMRKMILNPGTVSLTAGLLLMALPFDLPPLLAQPIGWIGGLNSPLAMIVMGIYLSKTSFAPQKGDSSLWFSCTVRLVIVPAALLGGMALLRLPYEWALACLIVSAAPPATNVLMFASFFGGDASLAARTVAWGNIASILTMPLLIGLGMMLQ